MRKSIIIALLFCYCQLSFANHYRVEIGVFENGVGFDYFYNVEDIKLAVDVNGFYRYYVGDFEDKGKAEAAKNDAISKGYNARVIDLMKLREACATFCKAPLYVENIFFDFDRSNLRSKSRRDLDDLAELMTDNPDYKVELSAHTDARGSLEYNTALSNRRSSAAKDYLIARGISSSRIITSEFGETSPIAKNDLNGQDSPSGRQFNRRVVVTVMKSSGSIVPNVVKPINIPEILKAN